MTKGNGAPPNGEAAANRPGPSFVKARELAGPAWLGRWLLRGENTGGSLALRECELPVGYATPPHMLLHDDVSVMVLEGRVDFACDGERAELGAGDCAYLPARRPRSLNNLAPTASRVLLVFAPPVTLETMLNEFDRLAAAGNLTPGEARRLATFYGLIVADPGKADA
ncbi:MAG: cupin domain-containing protein [Planctomycetota bacterium]